ncbi:tyrosine-type recombinase/integrase [Sporichthya polymorpha]|uniref:tyrosine-type recombinase/integrase n=1 Tax=Sporichthya polymorpha TaxID=35751 RepID=UPI00039F4794|nr:tyrosine-type recombinase/integrase [Sporichthya polymorpha]
MLDLGWIDGKRRRPIVTGATKAEVVAKLRQLRGAQDKGVDIAAPPRTLAAWLDEWMTDIKALDGTRPSTLDRYRIAIDSHIKPGLGQIRLDKLRPRDVQLFLAARAEVVAPATVVKIHAVLRSALSDAERLDLIARNAAKAARSPSLAKPERRVLTVEEAKRLLTAAASNRLEGVLVVALTLGLRRGEILGLRWSDVDLDNRVLHVRQAVQRAGGSLRIVEPKTHRSRRVLPIPAVAVPAFERQRARQAAERLAAGPAWQDNGLVFASTLGTPMEPRNVNRRFELLRASADLDWLRMHDLRHACATFLIAHGVDHRTVMEVLGHSTIRLTMDTYTHVLDERLRAAAEAMDRALGSPS